MKPIGRVQKSVLRAFRARPKHSFTTRELLAWTHPRGAAFFRLNEDLLPVVQSRTQMIPKLKEFRRPVRIIFGDADPSLNSGVARTFHEFLPGSELFLIPGARHFVQLDEPEQVARLIPCQGRGARRPNAWQQTRRCQRRNTDSNRSQQEAVHGPVTRRFDQQDFAVVDTNGLPVRLALS
jgi:hypothetical protein